MGDLQSDTADNMEIHVCKQNNIDNQRHKDLYVTNIIPKMNFSFLFTHSIDV